MTVIFTALAAPLHLRHLRGKNLVCRASAASGSELHHG
jgi:hypothetical protein